MHSQKSYQSEVPVTIGKESNQSLNHSSKGAQSISCVGIGSKESNQSVE
jgi:hypothetical protein